MLASEIVAALESLPTLFSALSNLEPDAVKLYADVAHGTNDGMQKVQKALSDLGALFTGAAAAAPAVAAAVVPPPAA